MAIDTAPLRPPKPPRPTPVPRVRSDLIDRLAPEDVPMFWEQIAERLPLVEETATPGEVVVTFCWRDAEAEQVLLFANRLTDETDLDDTLLERLGDSDLWHASFLMEADWRASYSFLTKAPGEPAPWLAGDQASVRAALDQGRLDPRNPETCVVRHGLPRSVASMPQAPAQPWLAPREGTPTGTVTRQVAPDGRRLWVYDPPGVAEETALPLLVVLDGEVWLEMHDLPTTLDNMIDDAAVPPLRALFVDSVDHATRWAELSATGGGADLVDRLLPWVAERRGVLDGHVAVAGQSLGGLTALRAALRRPDLAAISHSASLWQDDLAEEVARLAGHTARPRVVLGHGRQEWVLTEPHHDLARRLRDAGVEVEEAVYNGGHDYAWWRGAIADGLRTLWG